ncbi:MAG: RNA-binding transcriptional accessory protein [Planctomycetales bacterium]|nr:RNA-binding transcriptional accessory protein [Planctomycetales bacterium]
MSNPPTVDLAAIAKQLRFAQAKVRSTVELLDAGNTVPFITRYRKDQTGGLDEEQIRQIQQAVTARRLLEERKQTILRSIESQGKLTDDLSEAILAAETTKRLEDLYLPYKPRKQTRATAAREKGLEPLAREILADDKACANLDLRAADFVNTDKGVALAADALLGAGHILAEQFSERADLRDEVRKIYRGSGQLVCAKAEGASEKASKSYRDYFEFRAALGDLPPHRVLAINRGEKAKALRVRVEADQAAMQQAAERFVVPEGHTHADFLRGCALDALQRLVVPSLEREVRREMTERAETHAVHVFARNLKNLLLQSPVRGKRVVAIDPGFKNGCKIAALDEFGNVLAHEVIHLIGSDERKADGRKRLAELIIEHRSDLAAIGNGTACRETEELLAAMIADELKETELRYVVVNEAGASVYSASPLGREELPNYDATIRGAVSIGRRLQDPLSELVKIDPGSIGVGLYQHDVKEKHLQSSLDDVVESCVNFVGVDLNSASPALLSYVSGLNQLTARRVYDYRVANGPFKRRQDLLEVQGVGEGVFVQAAGFLKIADGENPLDATWIHPESYHVADKVLQRLDAQAGDLTASERRDPLAERLKQLDTASLSSELEVGELSLGDILTSLAKPGRDPREDFSPPLFRKDVVKLEDLCEGMELMGTVLNVVDFGAFVDIGVSDSGLVHISQIANNYVRDPHERLAAGDLVKVWVREVDKARRRVSLTMIPPGEETAAEPKPEPKQRRPRRKDRPRRNAKSEQSSGQRRDKPAGRSRGKRSDKPAKPKKPLVPITDSMAKGQEPMRTFGDLIQFYELKKGEGKER